MSSAPEYEATFLRLSLCRLALDSECGFDPRDCVLFCLQHGRHQVTCLSAGVLGEPASIIRFAANLLKSSGRISQRLVVLCGLLKVICSGGKHLDEFSKIRGGIPSECERFRD